MRVIFDTDALVYFENLSDIIFDSKLSDRIKFLRIIKVIKSVYKSIVKDENQTFSSFYSMLFFVHSKFEIDPTYLADYNQLKKFENQFYADKSIIPEQSVIDFALFVALNCIELFSDAQLPEHFIVFRTKFKPAGFDLVSKKQKFADIELLRVSVIEKGSRIVEKGIIKSCELYCYNEELGDIRIQIYGNYAELNKFVWKGCILNLINIKCKKGNEYFTSIDSIVVLEPDYLVDVTEIQSASQKIHLIQKYIF